MLKFFSIFIIIFEFFIFIKNKHSKKIYLIKHNEKYNNNRSIKKLERNLDSNLEFLFQFIKKKFILFKELYCLIFLFSINKQTYITLNSDFVLIEIKNISFEYFIFSYLK